MKKFEKGVGKNVFAVFSLRAKSPGTMGPLKTLDSGKRPRLM